MRRVISRYRSNFPGTIIYMLQASEYNLAEFWSWYWRTRDFGRVAVRKQLVLTAKARLLLMAAYVLAIILVVIEFLFILTALVAPGWWMAVLLLAIILPELVAVGVATVLLAGDVLIKRPQRESLMTAARRQLADHPATKIAIAGSYGKTTFKDVLATVLKEGKTVAVTPGNINTPIGISRWVKSLSGQEEVLIFELGEYYPGDIRELCELVQPDLGVITGINEAHLSKFKTVERTVATIFELVDCLGPEKILANGESRLVKEHAGPGMKLYDRHGMGTWKISDAVTGLEVGSPPHSGITFVTHSGEHQIKVESGLLGLHQVGPLVAVIELATQLGLTPVQIEAGLALTQPFEHRLQLHINAGVTTIDDSYNGNPDGAEAAINFLAGLKGRRTYATPGLVEMGSRTEEVHEALGRQLAEAGIERVVLIRNSAGPQIEAGLRAAKFEGELIWFDDGPAAFAALPAMMAKGDVVLIQNDWPDNYA